MSGFGRESGSVGNTSVPPPARVHRVRCPGLAHGSGGNCLICDPENDGTIEVFLTDADLSTLARAAQGLRIDASLALRLRRLGLLVDVGGCLVPTAHVPSH